MSLTFEITQSNISLSRDSGKIRSWIANVKSAGIRWTPE